MKPPLIVTLIFFLLNGCLYEEDKKPGKPLVSVNFDGEIKNDGLSPVLINGDSLVSFAITKKDTSLDLSASARYRKPVSIYSDNSFSLDDYKGFTVCIWVKKAIGDSEKYTIVTQKDGDLDRFIGWQIEAAENGSWKWTISDSINTWRYVPTVQKQSINDGSWHQLAFSFNKETQEGSIYYDGENVALYSLSDIHLDLAFTPFYIGVDPYAPDVKMETFNGQIDDFGVWSRPLSRGEIAQLYKTKSGKRIANASTMDEELKVMSWNIWHGGRHEGRQVGVERVIEIIEASGADIILLQETYGSGEKIADALNYHYYRRSSNLSVLSRFPFSDSYNMFRPFNFGCIKVEVGKARTVLACPVWLHYLPNTGSYVKSGHAVPDSIIAREMETRGLEIKLILSELRQFMLKKDEIPLIMAGDFNSGSHLDWTDRNHANYYGLTVTYPVSQQMEDAGFRDSYRELFQDESVHLGQTWSPIFKSSMQDRIDYIYYSGDKLKPVNSKVIDSHPLGFPSDHAAVVTTFQWQKNE
ncbi:MAG: endonuclease/exonuclease/phosphatase family protein [Marinilabiliaceae bacterium]|nr:endonuclease/exonuclease/phosphatase family protein [Marinilabiliaceae bacterium]